MPSQKIGTVTPMFARIVITVSAHLPLLTAHMTPAGMPTNILMIKANRLRWRVMGNLRFISFITGSANTMDSPKSPRATFNNQSKYCTVRGLSNPYSCLKDSISSCVISFISLWDIIIRIGSPGRSRTARNTIIVTIIRTKSA